MSKTTMKAKTWIRIQKNKLKKAVNKQARVSEKILIEKKKILLGIAKDNFSKLIKGDKK